MLGNIFEGIRILLSLRLREIGHRLWRNGQKRNYKDDDSAQDTVDIAENLPLLSFTAVDDNIAEDTADFMENAPIVPFTVEDEFYVFDEMGTRMDTRLNIKLWASMNEDYVTF
ncbi:hypothetical protein CHS0354_010415 [Potamilus streckersoni]|uniref:Uncharacterized protein n=1 Tax=Potamilus streckersoni TaxID=2493646 RepID=A0AAE0RQT0_9BIVA|nr:hypothetical protein CHS0354_010415 [Potamilus streckersoni]